MLMERTITLKIAGVDFHVKASSPDVESSMRTAAEEINRMMDRYDQKYPDKSLTDKLLFVTITQTVYRLQTQGKYTALANEGSKLESELSSYLEGIKSDR